MLVLISTEFASAGVLVKDGLVVETAPIYSWMVGKRWDDVKRWSKVRALHNVDSQKPTK